MTSWHARQPEPSTTQLEAMNNHGAALFRYTTHHRNFAHLGEEPVLEPVLSEDDQTIMQGGMGADIMGGGFGNDFKVVRGEDKIGARPARPQAPPPDAADPRCLEEPRREPARGRRAAEARSGRSAL